MSDVKFGKGKMWNLAILLLYVAHVVTGLKRVEICGDVGEQVESSSILEDYRGRNVVLAFSGTQCQGCATRLLRLTEVSRQFRIDVLVITPPHETREDLKQATRHYPKLRFEAAPCSPCEFDYLLDTNSSKIFVLDSCSRLLHRYDRSTEHLTQLRAKFPVSLSCGQPCSTERRKRDPSNSLPPVGCGPRKQITAIVVSAQSPYDLKLQMLPENEQEALNSANTYTTVDQQQVSANQKHRQYKQIFQSGTQRPPIQQQVPQPVVSVSYNGQQQYPQQTQYGNRYVPATQAQPVYQTEHVQQQSSRQQVYTSNKPGTRFQGRYQKYQPETQTQHTQMTTTQSPPRNPATNRYNIDRLEQQRQQLAKQREEHARKLKLQNEQTSGQPDPSTQLEAPPTTQSSNTVSFTQAFRLQHQHHYQPATRQESQHQQTTAMPKPTPSTTRRPPKTTKNPLVYSNQQSSSSFGRRTYGHLPYESTYQMQQRRRNELAAQRQRQIQARQKQELEALQRQELQRQIAEQEARQKAAQAAYEEKLKTSNLEAAPLYHDDNAGNVAENVNLEEYYEDIDVEEWTTAIPQVRLESPPSPEPLPENVAEHPEFLFDLPCNGFSDEICYQQQSQLEPKEVHKCCQARIVLTDQCVPGRCSNVTNQLCCIQKLLQAKFKCCNDKTQGEVLFAGDSFSRCCFDGFVDEEDPCCPQAYALHHWRSIYELCLPAVNVDMSQVRVPQKIVAGLSTTVNFDFSKTDKWRFECKYGSHVPQYSYFPEEDSEKTV